MPGRVGPPALSVVAAAPRAGGGDVTPPRLVEEAETAGERRRRTGSAGVRPVCSVCRRTVE